MGGGGLAWRLGCVGSTHDMRADAQGGAGLGEAEGSAGSSARGRTSTSFRSHRVSTCCTSSLVRPGFQHERSKLLRKSAAHSSSAILGADMASAVFFSRGIFPARSCFLVAVVLGSAFTGVFNLGGEPPNRFFLGCFGAGAPFSARHRHSKRQQDCRCMDRPLPAEAASTLPGALLSATYPPFSRETGSAEP